MYNPAPQARSSITTMDQTPTQPPRTGGQDRRISFYKDELVEVQRLYYERRYKQCIDLCDRLQRPEIHAIHQAFLLFYHAVSYESMGLLAHNFSNRKVEFLDSAKQSFSLALGCLPLPFVSTESGMYQQEENSPVILSFAVPCPSQSRIKQDAASDAPEDTIFPRSVSSSSFYSTESAIVDAKRDTPPPPCTPPDRKESPQQSPVGTRLTPATHKSRLSQSLSLTHVLEDELVPSPLFSRAPKQIQMDGAGDNDTSKPLPPLPFNHRSSFTIQGGRVVQDPPLRKTAVQTLIARYEGILPLPPSPSPQTPSSSPLTRRQCEDCTMSLFSSSSPSPSPSSATPRFQMIRDAFSPDPRNAHLEAYLSSTQLARFNAALAASRSNLRKHVADVDREIDRVQKIQTDRTAAKALTKNRFASFWSFDMATASASASGSSSRSTNKPRATRSKISSRAADNGDPAVGGGTGTGRRERIEKLRREGWKVYEGEARVQGRQVVR